MESSSNFIIDSKICIIIIGILYRFHRKGKKFQSRKKNSTMKYPNFIQFTISDDSRSIFHNQQRKFLLLIRDKTVFRIRVTNIKNQRSTRKIRLRENRACGISRSIYRAIDDLKFHVSSPVPYFPRKKTRRDRSFHD